MTAARLRRPCEWRRAEQYRGRPGSAFEKHWKLQPWQSPIELQAKLHPPRSVVLRRDEPEVVAAEVDVGRSPHHPVEDIEYLDPHVQVELLRGLDRLGHAHAL